MGKYLAHGVALVAIVVLLAGCGATTTGAASSLETVAKDGGARIVLQAACPPDQSGCDLGAAMATAAAMLRARAAALGVADPVARASGNDQITVDLPGVMNDAQLRQALTTPGRVEFIDTGGMSFPVGSSVAGKLCMSACRDGQYRVLFTGSQLDPSSIGAKLDPQTGQPIVTFGFNAASRQAFADYTRQHIGQYLTVTLDSTIIESATIQSEIAGAGEVTGLSSMDQARNLAAYMQYGALPVALSIVSDQHIAPGA